MRRIGLIAFSSLLLAGTAPLAAQSQPRTVAPAATVDGLPGGRAPVRAANQPRYGTFGIDLAARDLNVKPGDDFNRYANGTWLNAVQIPADRTQWSLWTTLAEDIEQQLKTIVDEARGARSASNPAMQRIGAYYTA